MNTTFKPFVFRSRTFGAWAVNCHCTPGLAVVWLDTDRRERCLADTQSEAFSRATTHARREHWTPEVAR